MPILPFDTWADDLTTLGTFAFTAEAALIHDAEPSAREFPESPLTQVSRANARFSNPGDAPFGLVYPLRKRPGSIFEHIGIGRAANVDVIITLAEVSAYHAYVDRDAHADFTIADAGSRNGTRVGLQKLAPRSPSRLANGCRVYLGTHRFTFVTATGLRELLHKHRPG